MANVKMFQFLISPSPIGPGLSFSDRGMFFQKITYVSNTFVDKFEIWATGLIFEVENNIRQCSLICDDIVESSKS